MPRARNRTGLSFGEGTIQERVLVDGSVRYRARWWDTFPGEPTICRSKTFATKDAAEDHLREVIRTKRDHRYRSPSTMTVNDLVSEYIERASTRISERTKLTYLNRAASMIAPSIGSHKVEGLTPLDLQRWIDGLSRKGFAASTIHAAVAVMMGALREAAMLGITDRHLGAGVRRPTIRRDEPATWTEAEVKRVLRSVSGDLRFDALYHVAIATGMRPGELRALQWADVDLERGILRVRRTITKDTTGTEISATRTKTGKGRAIALAPAIVEKLRWHRARQNERRLASDRWHNLDLVFDRGDGHWLYQGHWRKRQIALCEEAGVPFVTAHGLRHSSASLEIAAGTPIKIVSERLGHASVAMTLDIYQHVSPDMQRAAADALADRLFSDETEARVKVMNSGNGPS